MAKTNISAEELRALLHYAPETGIFTWLVDRRSIKLAGKRAGNRDNQSGYRSVWVAGKGYAEHRLAWFYVYGSWPTGDIDHINGVGDDNRIANLRDTTTAQNCQNQRRSRSNSASKLIGAKKFRTGQWQSAIKVDGKQIHLGTFESQEAAHEAYVAAKRLHHPFNTL